MHTEYCTLYSVVYSAEVAELLRTDYMLTSAIQPRETGIRDGVDPHSVSKLIISRDSQIKPKCLCFNRPLGKAVQNLACVFLEVISYVAQR